MSGPVTAALPVVLAVLLVAITWTDIRSGVIRNSHNAMLALSGIAYNDLQAGSVLASLTGALFGGSLLYLVFALHRFWRGQAGLGLGDVKFMIGAGAWVNWYGIAPLLVISSLLALVFLIVSRKSLRFDHRLPFGPFLAAALALVFSAEKLDLAPWVMV